MTATWILLALLTATSPAPRIVELGRHPTHDTCQLAAAELPRFADTVYACTLEATA